LLTTEAQRTQKDAQRKLKLRHSSAENLVAEIQGKAPVAKYDHEMMLVIDAGGDGNSFSLRRSEMFIATSAREKLSLRRSETWKQNDCHGKQKRLRSYGAPEEGRTSRL